jgi:hypothetical protein
MDVMIKAVPPDIRLASGHDLATGADAPVRPVLFGTQMQRAGKAGGGGRLRFCNRATT